MKKGVIIGLIVILILAIGVYIYLQKQEGEIIEPVDLTQVTFLSGDAADPTWSPDGNQIAFAYFTTNKIGIINTDGTGLRYLDMGGVARWSPIENKLAVIGGEEENLPSFGIHLVDFDTEETTFLVMGDLPSWSPDGTKIAYASGGTKVADRSDEEEDSSSIWVINIDGSEKTRLTIDEDGFCTGPSFSYDGSKIVYLKGATDYSTMGEFRYGSNELWIMNNDGSNKHQIYAPDDISMLIFGRAWNKNNKILFMSSTIHEVSPPSSWVINSDGSDPHPIGQHSENMYGDPVWSKDGTQIAVSKIDLTNIDIENILESADVEDINISANIFIFPYGGE